MKNIIITLGLILACSLGFSQETYTVNNESLSLKTEVDGTLDLLYTTGDDGKFRYFIKTEDGTITELKNTKTGKDYNHEYQSTLYTFTDTNATDTKFTLYSLKKHINEYNKSQDSTFIADEPTKLGSKAAIFAGITNNPFVGNPGNDTAVFFSGELEVSNADNTSRHAVFANLRHTLTSGNLDYTSTQLGLGYRFRAVNKSKFKLFAQAKFATITYAKATLTQFDTVTNTLVSVDDTGTTFDAPFIFGIGADIQLSDSSAITFVYDNIVAAFIDNQGNFPIDFAIGYKFSL